VRVRRKRSVTPKYRVLNWYRDRRRRIRLWLVIGAMVALGFVSFVWVRNYVDSVAAAAEEGPLTR